MIVIDCAALSDTRPVHWCTSDAASGSVVVADAAAANGRKRTRHDVLHWWTQQHDGVRIDIVQITAGRVEKCGITLRNRDPYRSGLAWRHTKFESSLLERQDWFQFRVALQMAKATKTLINLVVALYTVHASTFCRVHIVHEFQRWPHER
jgi:hypothetical protein